MKTRKIDFLDFVRRQKPYKAKCSHCLATIYGDSEKEVIEKLEEEKWGVVENFLCCNKCYEIYSWE